MKKFLICISLLSFGYIQAQQVAIIPQPQELKLNQEKFQINAHTTIQLDKVSENDIHLWLQQTKIRLSYRYPEVGFFGFTSYTRISKGGLLELYRGGIS